MPDVGQADPYGHLSDTDLDKMLQQSDPYAHLSDADLDKMLAKGGGEYDQDPEPFRTINKVATGVAGTVGGLYDRLVSAPARAGVYDMQTQGSPLSGDANLGIGAWANQFGRDPSKAPTGKDIAIKAGLPDTTKAQGRSVQQKEEFDQQNNPGLYQAMKGRYQADKPNTPADIGGGFLNAAIDPGLIMGSELARPLVEGGMTRAGKSLGKFAENAAVNATGATGKQASTFKPNAGRELLDRGLVGFGDSQENIANNASAAVDKANADIDHSLSALQESGVKIDENKVYSVIRDKINSLKQDSSTVGLANQLESELNNVLTASDARGSPELGIKNAEQTKRNYNRAGTNWMDPKSAQASKEMYRAYKGEVENAANAANPELASKFEEGKKSFGLLSPIEEAAQRRASTTNQHPPLGFLDMVSSAAGAHASGPGGAIIAPVARRLISPRISSSVAVGADKLSKGLLGLKENVVSPAYGYLNQEIAPSPLQSVQNEAGQIGERGGLLKPDFSNKKPSSPNPFEQQSVVPFKTREQIMDQGFKQRALDRLRKDTSNYGGYASPADAIRSKYGYLEDTRPPESWDAAKKYTDQINMDKAKGGEFSTYPASQYFDKDHPLYNVAKSQRDMQLKQFTQNLENLKSMAAEIDRMGPNAPKDLVDMYKNMAEQTFQTRKELNINKDSRLPSPESLVGGEVIPAQDAFEMWGGRPNPPGQKGKLIDRSRGLIKND